MCQLWGKGRLDGRDWTREREYELVFLGVVEPIADGIGVCEDYVGAGSVLLEVKVLAVEAEGDGMVAV